MRSSSQVGIRDFSIACWTSRAERQHGHYSFNSSVLHTLAAERFPASSQFPDGYIQGCPPAAVPCLARCGLSAARRVPDNEAAPSLASRAGHYELALHQHSQQSAHSQPELDWSRQRSSRPTMCCTKGLYIFLVPPQLSLNSKDILRFPTGQLQPLGHRKPRVGVRRANHAPLQPSHRPLGSCKAYRENLPLSGDLADSSSWAARSLTVPPSSLPSCGAGTAVLTDSGRPLGPPRQNQCHAEPGSGFPGRPFMSILLPCQVNATKRRTTLVLP